MKECRITISLAKPIKFGLFFPEGLFNCKCLLEISLAVISRANNSLEKPCCWLRDCTSFTFWATSLVARWMFPKKCQNSCFLTLPFNFFSFCFRTCMEQPKIGWLQTSTIILLQFWWSNQTTINLNGGWHGGFGIIKRKHKREMIRFKMDMCNIGNTTPRIKAKVVTQGVAKPYINRLSFVPTIAPSEFYPSGWNMQKTQKVAPRR